MSRLDKINRLEKRIRKLNIPGWALTAAQRGAGVRLADGREITKEDVEIFLALLRKRKEMRENENDCNSRREGSL